MKKLKNRWENELKTAVPALSDSVKNAAIPKTETQSSIVKTSSLKVENKRVKLWQRRGFWATVSGGVACAFAVAIILPNTLKNPTTGASADEMKIMNISCNPSVEFVLDEESLVVTANALNEEGNLVISAESFVGLTAEEAAYLFVEIAQESGFIVAGDAQAVGASNKIVVAFSGDETASENLFEGVRVRVEGYFSEKEIKGEIEKTSTVTEEEIEEILAKCMPHVEGEKIREMNYADLMKELAKNRKETENIYSQELKAAYYEMKSFALEQAEIDVIKANADTITAAVLDGIYTEYVNAISNIENFRMEYLVNEDSEYQQALAAFRAAKVEYLQYRSEVAQIGLTELPPDILDALANYEATLERLQAQLLEIGNRAHDNLDALKSQVEDLFAEIDNSLQGLGIDKDSIAENIVTERDKADKGFREYFEVKCEKEIGTAHDRWTEMKGELDKGKPNADGEHSPEDKGEGNGDGIPPESGNDKENGDVPSEGFSEGNSSEEANEEIPELENGENHGGHGQVHP